MIVVCPSCAAHYGIDREAFGPNARVVHCSACDHEWEAVPGAADPAEVGQEEAWRADPAADGGIAGSLGAAEPEEGAVTGWDSVPVPTESVAETHADEPEDDEEKIAADSRLSDDLRLDIAAEPPGEPEYGPREALVFSEPEDDSPRAGEPALAAEQAAAPATENGDEPIAPGRRRRLIMAAGGGAALVLSLLALIAAEAPITRAWPGAAAVYSIFGLAPAPPGAGLDIRDVSSSREWTGSEDVLVVAGTVANVAAGTRGLPPLRVTLFDADRSELQTVVVQPSKASLAEGESMPFVARIASPAITARRVVVSFQLSPAEHG